MKKSKFVVFALIGALLLAGAVFAAMMFTSCGLAPCSKSCGNALMECTNTMEVGCEGLLGGWVDCSSACSGDL